MNPLKRRILNSILSIVLLVGIPACAHSNKIESPVLPKPVIVQRLPGFNPATQIGEREYFSPSEVSLALLLFYELWYTNIGDPDQVILTSLQNITILWMPDDWLLSGFAYGEQGQIVNGDFVVRGITYNKTLIGVAAKTTMSETALMHELIHFAIWNLYPESLGDPDHLGNKYDFWTPQHSALKDLANKILIIHMNNPASSN